LSILVYSRSSENADQSPFLPSGLFIDKLLSYRKLGLAHQTFALVPGMAILLAVDMLLPPAACTMHHGHGSAAASSDLA
jgi:hypothetical protein